MTGAWFVSVAMIPTMALFNLLTAVACLVCVRSTARWRARARMIEDAAIVVTGGYQDHPAALPYPGGPDEIHRQSLAGLVAWANGEGRDVPLLVSRNVAVWVVPARAVVTVPRNERRYDLTPAHGSPPAD